MGDVIGIPIVSLLWASNGREEMCQIGKKNIKPKSTLEGEIGLNPNLEKKETKGTYLIPYSKHNHPSQNNMMMGESNGYVWPEEEGSNLDIIEIVDPKCTIQSTSKILNCNQGVEKKKGRKLSKNKREEMTNEKGLTNIKDYILRFKGGSNYLIEPWISYHEMLAAQMSLTNNAWPSTILTLCWLINYTTTRNKIKSPKVSLFMSHYKGWLGPLLEAPSATNGLGFLWKPNRVSIDLCYMKSY